jgi:Family of unknown function (DUF6665)
MKPFGKVPPGRREAALASVEDEIRGERARALGRTIRALEDALAALSGPVPASRAGRAAREELVLDAAERLWFAVVQREALGLHRHDQLLRELRVPEEVARRMGPRRRRA